MKATTAQKQELKELKKFQQKMNHVFRFSTLDPDDDLEMSLRSQIRICNNADDYSDFDIDLKIKDIKRMMELEIGDSFLCSVDADNEKCERIS